MRHDEREMLEAAAKAVDGERSIASVARETGVAYATMHAWVRRLRAAREREEAERDAEEARRLAAARALVGRPGEVVLLEVETPGGPALVMADRARDGTPSGTVRALAGAPLGTGPCVAGRVRRRWAVDARALARAVAASLSNNPESRVSQAAAMRSMTGGGA